MNLEFLGIAVTLTLTNALCILNKHVTSHNLFQMQIPKLTKAFQQIFGFLA